MGFRFWRRLRIAPGLTVNLSKSGASLSLGPRGAKFTVGPGGPRATIGMPGTGLFYTTTFSSPKPGRGKKPRPPAPPPPRPENRLTMSFFKRLVAPEEEEALVDACRELALGHEDTARRTLEGALHLADGAYLAGFLAIKAGQWSEAVNYLSAAAERSALLGTLFAKYGFSAEVSIPITNEISAHVGPNLRGVLLGLVEAYQHLNRPAEAIACLERLRRLEPDDVVVKLSLAELLLEARAENQRDIYQQVVHLAEGIENETPVHSALLLYKAKALRGLGLSQAARETLSLALRKTNGRSHELLRALRYQLALVYEDLGQHRRARAEWEKLYAEDPRYEDVAERLGLPKTER